MSRIDKWLSEEPPLPPAEIACRLARDRFWKDEHERLIGTHPDWPDAAHVLELNEELAHALVLVLSRLPAAERSDFAAVFYEERAGRAAWFPDDPHSRQTLAAAVVLRMADVVDTEICAERTFDLLQGAAQGDDLTRTPAPAVDALRKAIAHIRFDVDFDDPTNPRGAAALAVVEVLDPSSEVVDVKEVLARSAWAVVETRGRAAALGFLLDVDRLLADL
ncbi:MAG TPA: hypothetical protein VNP89_02245 [Gaiellaceae bacterium]|nr:hypothetical protein [Gaiellaceae bacterium]